MIKLSSFSLLNKLFCLASERTEYDRVITDQLVKHVLLYWIEHKWHNVICLNLQMSPSEKMNNDIVTARDRRESFHFDVNDDKQTC